MVTGYTLEFKPYKCVYKRFKRGVLTVVTGFTMEFKITAVIVELKVSCFTGEF